MSFKAGTERFRKVSGSNKGYFQKGVSFKGGDKFPLLKGKVGKDKLGGLRDHMFAVKDNG